MIVAALNNLLALLEGELGKLKKENLPYGAGSKGM
jgi:hypothetical protein